jgi:Leucine-rich repeat (LRR) protein
LETLDDNNLRGSIPEEIKALSLLEEVRITNHTSRNSINLGLLTQVAALGALTNLQILDLSWNQLETTIPREFFHLTNLEALYLDHNEFHGVIPDELNALTNLKRLHLEDNLLEGWAGLAIVQNIKLEELVLDDNKQLKLLGWNLDGLTNLQVLSLGGADIEYQQIPLSLRFMLNLTVLNLENTGLDGTIPAELQLSTTLQTFSLHDNFLEGSIPWLKFSENLVDLDLGSNSFSGVLPMEIGRFANLTSLHLAKNDFSGTIPSTIGQLTSLRKLDLSRNDLNGMLPTELGLLTSLGT